MIARAMIENPSTGYSASVPFIDPNKSRSSKLHGAGLRIEAVEGEELTPVIVARNIGEKTATLHGRINYTRSDGSRGVMPIRGVSLNADEVKTWEIAEVAALRRAEIRSAGLEFDYNTQPGSLMVSAFSVGSKGNQVFQVPMLDPSAQTSSTGVYPFYLDYGSSTMVYIKNTSKEDQKYIAHLVYEESRYRLGVKTIAAGETVAIDIRSLRDSQIPDEEGEIIPANVVRGQLRWTRIEDEGTDSPAMIGRAEQVYEGRAMSSTYACQSCCGDVPISKYISPSLGEIQIGQIVQMHAFEKRADCFGWEYPVEQPASWKSSNQQVATIRDGQITFVGGGQTTITASWNSSFSLATQCSGGPGFLPGPEPIGPVTCCDSRFQPKSESMIVQVVPPEISEIFQPRGVVGLTYTVEIRGRGFGSNPSVKPMDGITVTIDRFVSNSTKIVADFEISPNAGQGNRNVIVVVGSKESPPKSFLVQVPGSVKRDSISGPNVREPGPVTINERPNRCGAYWDLTYQLYDKGNPAQKIGEIVDVTETVVFPDEENFIKTKPTNQNGIFADVLGITKPHPACPSNGETATAIQTFVVNIEGRTYTLTTKHRIEFRKLDGQYSVNVVVEVP